MCVCARINEENKEAGESGIIRVSRRLFFCNRLLLLFHEIYSFLESVICVCGGTNPNPIGHVGRGPITPSSHKG